MYLAIGVISALVEGVLWIKCENETGRQLSPRMACAIALILFGAANLFVGMYGYIESSDKNKNKKTRASGSSSWA